MNPASTEKELRILMLEDSAKDAELLERELRTGGLTFRARRVESEEAFRTALRDVPPDLILLDNELPDFNGEAGLAVAQEICPDVPLIFVSGTIGDEEAVELLKRGVTDYVLKDRRSRLVPAVKRALREARENRARRILASIVKGASDAILSKTLEGIITSWNPGAESLFGYTEEEIIGQPITVLIPQDRLHEETTILEKIGRGEEIEHFETVRLRKNGTAVEVSVTISPIKDEQGKVTGVSKILRDITDRKEAEATRLEREQEFEALVENAPDIISRYDRQFRHLYVNRAISKATGLPASAFIGKTHEELGMPRHLQAEWQAVLEDVFTSGEVRETEYEFATPGGTRFYQSRLVPEPSADGSVCCVLNIARDITERKQAESHLLHSEANLAASQRIAHLGSWELDLVSVQDLAQGDLRWSDEVFRIWGYQPGGIEVSYENFLAAVHPDDRGLIDIAVSDALRESRPYDLTHRILRADGAERIVHEMAEFVFEEGSGRPLRMIGTVLDITEQRRAEENLVKLNERFDLAARSAELGIWDWDVPNNQLVWDNRMYELYGVRREDFSGAYEAWVQGLHPEDATQGNVEIQQALQGEKDFDTEFRVVWPDGSVHHIRAFAQVLRDANGQPLRMTGINYDITPRKQAEESLRLLSSAIEQSTESILITDAQLDSPGPNITFVNPAFTQMTGYPAAEVIGKSPRILQGPKTDRAVLQRLRENLAHGESFAGEAINYRKDGTEYDQEWQVNPIHDAKGNTTHYVAIQRDITKRKQAEAKLAEQAALLDQTHDAIVVRDMEGKVLFWSQGAVRLYGWTKQEAIGQPVMDLMYGKDQPLRKSAMDELVKEGRWSGELIHLAKDGKKLNVEVHWTLLRGDDGEPKSVVGINTDITEKKKIESQFLRAQRMESIGTLASGIAHDLNNILAPILMSVEMLKSQVQSSQGLQMLETLEVSAQRGADIVRQVLSFGRGMEGVRLEVQPKHLLKDMEHILRDTFPKNIRFHLEVGEELWTILGDPTQLHQVVLNLCVNARDAMPEGGSLTVSVKNHLVDEQYAAMNFQAKPGNYVVLSVSDTGSGIPQGILDKIFDPFFTTKEIGKGTGLGLSTVQAIVKSHEGFMSVYSEPDKGTTFRLYLPARIASTEEQEHPTLARLPRGNGELVLVIDDELSILTITRQTLEAFSYRVLVANNGAEGLAFFAQRHQEIAVVLTDMMMPVMDGAATIYALKKIQPAVKIIAASGLNTNGGTAKAVSSGVTHFLTKPYTAQTLLEELRLILEVT